MTYEKQTWKTGDVVTSAKLNHMEDGIANADNIFIVGGVTMDEGGNPKGTLDKTWQEIHDAMLSKIGIAVLTGGDNIQQELVKAAIVTEGNYIVTIAGVRFEASTANGYPATDGGK